MRLPSTSATSPRHSMVEARVSPERLRRVYDVTSRFYRATASVFDRKARRLGLERAEIRPTDRVLEVGTGPGVSLREMAARCGSGGSAVGVDVSGRMLGMARRNRRPAGGPLPFLVQADGTRLPFRGSSFDVLVSAYLLDLLPLDGVRAALLEFHRVLRPDGRLVVVSMTRKDEAGGSWWEWLYQALPVWGAAWLMGGCRPLLLSRPVLEAGFQSVRRELVSQLVPSEIVVARKTGSQDAADSALQNSAANERMTKSPSPPGLNQ